MVGFMQRVTRRVLGVQQVRAVPRRGPRPAIGAYVVREDVRMVVQAGLGDELWDWLLENGWRELTYRPDRRRYREIPGSWVTRLIDALPETRGELMRTAITRATSRPTLGDPDSLPSYIVRK